MFLTLLVVTFAIATGVSIMVAAVFRRPVERILTRIIADDISSTWSRYLMFALFVVAISSGVRIWDLEKYITKPLVKGAEIVELTPDRWILELYRTVIGTLQGLAWVLLVFFVVALMAFVLVRMFELRGVKISAISSHPDGGGPPTQTAIANSSVAQAPGHSLPTAG
jgi:hypothetical protein